jgi:methylmalonyl-CoA mutase N-terminal domain/subunit
VAGSLAKRLVTREVAIMGLETKGLEESFWERIRRTKTWSGYPLKEVYGPQDVEGLEYHRDLSWPGEYPFTRGSYSQGYRGRLWSTRELTGVESPSLTNKRFKYQIEVGANALTMLVDTPTHIYVDSDHPMAVDEVGRQGIPFDSLQDMEELLESIPMEKVSFAIQACWGAVVASYLALAEKRGLDISKLRGSNVSSPLEIMMCHMPKGWKTAEMALREAGDLLEFCCQRLPLWPALNAAANLWREWSIGAAKEMAIGLLVAKEYIKAGLKKGLDINQIAPRINITGSGSIEIFEEAAKFRASRRLWARIVKEEFGATDPRACRARFMCLTSGARCVYAQPLNNIIRLSYMGLGAILGGVQALGVSGYDEPLGLPTEQANLLSLRTQQILAHESGVANVADPLGGSYYVEWLTNTLEEEIGKEMERIESRGGIAQAIESGWLEAENFQAADKYQQEVESGERIIVGVNAYTVPEEEEVHPRVYQVSDEEIRLKIAKLKELKRNRDHEKLHQAMKKLYQAFKNKDQNYFPALVDAMKVYGTVGETFGLFRMAYGLSYDPFGQLECPFEL